MNIGKHFLFKSWLAGSRIRYGYCVHMQHSERVRSTEGYSCNMIRDVDICKNLYVHVVPPGGTAKFHEFFFERTTKDMTARASYVMKMQVVAPPVGVSSWRQRFRYAEVFLQPSFLWFPRYLFPELSYATLTSAKIRTPIPGRQAARSCSVCFCMTKGQTELLLHDEDQSGCSTRANVVGMDWRIHPVFPQHVQWSSLIFFWPVSEVDAIEIAVLTPDTSSSALHSCPSQRACHKKRVAPQWRRGYKIKKKKKELCPSRDRH